MIDRSMVTQRARTQGFALIVVMVMLLLSCLVVLSSTRLSWLSERMLGAESDHQRAFAAAEALIRDAELDIRGLQAGSNLPCQPDPSFVGCRNFGAGHPLFPAGRKRSRHPPGAVGSVCDRVSAGHLSAGQRQNARA